MWPDRRILDRLGIALPIIQAPMAGAMDFELAASASEAGALGSLPCAMLSPADIRDQVDRFRRRVDGPLNLNFFCHAPPVRDNERQARWRERLAPYYRELGVDPAAAAQGPARTPFDAAACDLVEELRPAVVSFHFGLPSPELLARVRNTGAFVMSSATTVAEAQWLAANGVDAIIAQGAEAGGHRGTFLARGASTEVGTLALVPQMVDAVGVPVIAAGGIADARAIVAALALGAAAAQVGTAYLFCPEARISTAHRAALRRVRDDGTFITNVPTGRPARGIATRLMLEVGPMSELAPEFPLAAEAIAPLRAAAEARGSGDFSPLWAGQAAGLGRPLPAGELTRRLAAEALALLRRLSEQPTAPAGLL